MLIICSTCRLIDKDTSKTDRSDTSFNTSSASEFHSQDEYVQKSRSFTCSEIEHKSVQLKKKPRKLSRKGRNAKMSKKILRQIKDLSSDQNTEKMDSSHVFNKNVSVKDTVVTVKEKPIPDADTLNSPEHSVHGNEHKTVNRDEDNVNPDKETVTPDADTVNADEQSVHGYAETVTPDNYNVNPDEQIVNPNDVHVIVPVKTEQIDPEDVKPNVQQCVLHGNSAVSDQSDELFSEVPIKKEENEEESGMNDSPISVKGKLSDEVTGMSFAELVTTADNGKQEDVDVDVSFYTDSAQTLQADEKNTQYSGNNS